MVERACSGLKRSLHAGLKGVVWPLRAFVALLMMGPVLIAQADQQAEALPELFQQLENTTDPAQARAIEGDIWAQWMIAPDDNASLLMAQISRAMAQRRLDLALRLCNQLIDSAPEFAEAWNRRATIHYLLNNHEASVADIRQTLVLEPRHFGAISGLGLIFLREDNFEAALAAFEQVLAISPGSQSARTNAERLRNRLGQEI